MWGALRLSVQPYLRTVFFMTVDDIFPKRRSRSRPNCRNLYASSNQATLVTSACTLRVTACRQCCCCCCSQQLQQPSIMYDGTSASRLASLQIILCGCIPICFLPARLLAIRLEENYPQFVRWQSSCVCWCIDQSCCTPIFFATVITTCSPDKRMTLKQLQGTAWCIFSKRTLGSVYITTWLNITGCAVAPALC